SSALGLLLDRPGLLLHLRREVLAGLARRVGGALRQLLDLRLDAAGQLALPVARGDDRARDEPDAEGHHAGDQRAALHALADHLGRRGLRAVAGGRHRRHRVTDPLPGALDGAHHALAPRGHATAGPLPAAPHHPARAHAVTDGLEVASDVLALRGDVPAQLLGAHLICCRVHCASSLRVSTVSGATSLAASSRFRPSTTITAATIPTTAATMRKANPSGITSASPHAAAKHSSVRAR